MRYSSTFSAAGLFIVGGSFAYRVPDFVFGTDPAQGPFIKTYANESVYDATIMNDLEQTSDIAVVVKNANDDAVCVGGQFNLFSTGTNQTISGQFLMNNSTRPRLEAGEFLALGNLPDMKGEHEDRWSVSHNANLWFDRGCDENCTNCARPDVTGKYVNAPGEEKNGQVLSTNVMDLLEWAGYGKDLFSVDISNVRGKASGNMTFEFPLGGTGCTPMSCHVSQEWMKNVCPKENQWETNGVLGCKSDCAATEKNADCCIGDFLDPKACPRSSDFFTDACPHAYAWAYQDGVSGNEVMINGGCKPNGLVLITTG